jgi:hypothetical protein
LANAAPSIVVDVDRSSTIVVSPVDEQVLELQLHPAD